MSNNLLHNTLSNKYQKKSDKQHVLDNPDTYIGSVENINGDYFVFCDKTNRIINKNINIIPGLYKLFDEGIVNCRDHVIRMQQVIKENTGETNYPVTNIDISISDDGVITMTNDGNGIDILKHPEYDIWIPELIFGHLRTSTNYDKSEKKIVGGKNGFGFKLVLIWSTWGKVETVDHKTGKKYIQEFTDNLDVINKPTITKCKSKPYTKISFKPDYKRLNIDNLSKDFCELLYKRVYDVAAVTDKSVKVKLNNSLLQVKTFQNYVDLYIGDKSETERICESPNERWEYIVCITKTDEFSQVSFVNGIYTQKGGKHVDYIVNQIVKKITLYIKNKRHIDVKPASIKEQLMVFINCTIENPAFDSQTKDYLSTAVSNFGSQCEVSDKFIEKLAKMGIMTTACSLTELKENKAVKKTDGSKTKSIRGIPKLIDANNAGTNKSKNCILILCEGDSAKSGIVSGLSREDRNNIGIYPMKGKMFNIRGESLSRIADNKEITEIKQILGLEHGKNYTQEDVENKLRYGKVIFMTDQDLDGSHIKGLGINVFDSEWKSLINIPEFIGYMNTPILKATKGSQVKQFYNNGEFENWKKDNDINSWTIKYYKGLGTSTSSEFKEYFKHQKMVYFTSTGDECNSNIDMVFNKKRANDRKEWLSNYNRDTYLNTTKNNVTYTEFINNDLIHFSKYDNDRSIPNLTDGLKTSLRKILYSAFKRNLNREVKVAQFSGYVSEHSGYHHGEASLNAAIVGMAQNYVGSNNINLFKPLGQFGTRLTGGKDSASERYIFTHLSKITRMIYPEIDDKILNYIDDDGTFVEPIYYVPIIPMVLINGIKGIGTGFSTDIMSYNPIQIIEFLENVLSGVDVEDCGEIEPFYRGFLGTINKLDNKRYIIKGQYKIVNDDKVLITELPIGTWTQDYKEYIESIIDVKSKTEKKRESLGIKEYIDMSTDTSVEFTITFNTGVVKKLLSQEYENGVNGLEKLLKLYSLHSVTNMHLFDKDERLKKYDTPETIILEYYSIRLEYYNKRKIYLIDKLSKELDLLSNKARYIKCLLDDTIDLRRKSKKDIYTLLNDMKFSKNNNNDKNDNNNNNDDNDNDIENKQLNSFNYLIKMPMDSVSIENIDKIMNDHDNKSKELDTIKSKKIENMWLDELKILKQSYNEFLDESNMNNQKNQKSKTKK